MRDALVILAVIATIIFGGVELGRQNTWLGIGFVVLVFVALYCFVLALCLAADEDEQPTPNTDIDTELRKLIEDEGRRS